MVFDQLLSHIKELNAEKQYWFVRTDDGAYFDTYVNNNFIGIGWNAITVEDLTKLHPMDVKIKLARTNVPPLDLDITKNRGKVTGAYTKLKRFQNLRKGDVIVIPSNSSSRYAFGIIDDDKIFVELDKTNDCPYRKRRKVKWLEVKSASALDPVFFQIRITRHAISNIKRFENYIDNVISNLYLKAGYAHFVLDINTTNDINVKPLLSLLQSIQNLTEKINVEFDLNESVNDTSIKLNLQSPGKIEFKLPQGRTLILLAAILSIASGCQPDRSQMSAAEEQRLDSFVAVHQDTIDKVERDIDTLEVDKDKINAFK